MDHNTLKERDPVVDLESGGAGCDDDTIDGPISGNKRAKHMFSRLKNGLLGFENGTAEGECRVSSYSNSGNSSEVPRDNIELLIEKNSGLSGENVPLLEQEQVKEKCKMSSKKVSKPPRPPKGPSLDTSDLKLVKEISELAMKKRARIERMKARKKSRAVKSSSSSKSSLSAMVFTLIFFLVIIFQGICSRKNSIASFQGSPEPAATVNGLISVQLYSGLPASNSFGPSSTSPNFVDHVTGSEFRSPG